MGLLLGAATLWVLGLLQGSYSLAYELSLLVTPPRHELAPVAAICLANGLICVLCALWDHHHHQSWLTSLQATHPPRRRWIKRVVSGGLIGYLVLIISLGFMVPSPSWRGWSAVFSSIHPLELILLVLLVPVAEELLFRGYLRRGISALWSRLWQQFRPGSMIPDQSLTRAAGWCACLLFVICHMQPFLGPHWPGALGGQRWLPWGVILLSVICESLRQLGYSAATGIAIHVIANGSVYYFAAMAPEIFKLLPWLFLQAH